MTISVLWNNVNIALNAFKKSREVIWVDVLPFGKRNTLNNPTHEQSNGCGQLIWPERSVIAWIDNKN